MKRFIAAALAIASALAAHHAWAQAPAVSHTVPSAVAPEQPTDIAFVGANLAGTTGVWTNMPSAAIELTPGIEGNGTKADTVTYRVSLPPDAPVGIFGLRLATGQGISSLRLWMIDDLPSIQDSGGNKTVETAQEISLPIAVDGACEAESYDFYKINAAAGQRMSIEVVARRLGSALDPVIRLLDAAGRELAYSDDEAGLGADSRFVHVFAEAGTYFIEIRDIRYQGGANYRYRLRLGDFPLPTAPFPMGGRLGTSPKLTITGPAVESVPSMTAAVPSLVPGGRLPLAVKYPDGQGSAMLSLVASPLAEQVEFEPNDAPELASTIAVPGAVNGRFETAKDRDYYAIEAKAGQRFWLRGRTRSLGSPTDLFLRLYKADGAMVAEAEDAGTDDGLIDYTFPEDGVYRLMVEDLNRRGGPEHVYRIEAEAYRPGFTLAVEADKFDAPKAGVFVVKVTSARRDYNGPITLGLEGAGEGFTLANNVIAEGQNEVVMNITLPSALEPGQLLTMQVVGRAKIGEADFAARASTLTPLRAAFNGLAYPPAELDGSIGLGVSPVFPDFFQLAVDPVAFPQIAGTATFLVKATKLNGFDDPIALTVDSLPPGVTATVAPIEKGKAEVAVQLTGPGSLAEAEYPFRVTGSATFQNQPRQVVLPAAVLRVVKPIEVTVAPAGAVARGAAQKVKIVLTRNPAAAGAVTIAFKDLPPGLTVPAEISIAEGQNEVEIDLAAAADAAVGPAGLTVVATTKINDKPFTVESPPVAFEISMP
ncbi:MAG: PPC domain-containing protein [Pirellulales bacterium]